MTVSRRRLLVATGASALALPLASLTLDEQTPPAAPTEHSADVVIVGGGVGGCSAALAALRRGLRVILTEESAWLGGQFSSQAVVPDDHRWIEWRGANRSYRDFRTAVRAFYTANYPLTDDAAAMANFDPGNGWAHKLNFEPVVAHTVLAQMLQPYASEGRLRLFLGYSPVSAETDGDFVSAVTVRSAAGHTAICVAPYFIDATETGEVLARAGVEHVIGAEGGTGERHGRDTADERDQQPFTVVPLVGFTPGTRSLVEEPDGYDRWRRRFESVGPARTTDSDFVFDPISGTNWPTKNLWTYRRMLDRRLFRGWTGDLSGLNWPHNDYTGGPIVGVGDAEAADHLQRARQQSLSLVRWLQTEVPRYLSIGVGYPEIHLRPDSAGTVDGLAMRPYIRESRRIKARFTILERHVSTADRTDGQAEQFTDSVGVGAYRIDLHGTASSNGIYLPTHPFQIPMRALLPVRVRNLIAGAKNIGTTHITNGCYRLHPIEWGVGEAAAGIVQFCIGRRTEPARLAVRPDLIQDLQEILARDGVETSWPSAYRTSTV